MGTHFIRVHGRVIPIHDGEGARSQNVATAKGIAKKEGAKLKGKAIGVANEKYNQMNPTQQKAVKTGIKFTESLSQGAGLAAGVLGLVGGAKGAVNIADKAVDHYAAKAKAEKTKYTALGMAGAALAGGAAGALGARNMLSNSLGPISKIGSYKSFALSNAIKNHFLMGPNVKMRAGVAIATGLTAAAIGGYGRLKAREHEVRAAKLKTVSSALKNSKIIG